MHIIFVCSCVHYMQSETTEEDVGHVWVFRRTLMRKIWTSDSLFLRTERNGAFYLRQPSCHTLICRDSQHRDKNSHKSFSLKYLLHLRASFWG